MPLLYVLFSEEFRGQGYNTQMPVDISNMMVQVRNGRCSFRRFLPLASGRYCHVPDIYVQNAHCTVAILLQQHAGLCLLLQRRHARWPLPILGLYIRQQNTHAFALQI